MDAFTNVEKATTGTACVAIPQKCQADLGAIYRTYRPRIYKQCFRMMRNEADAEDLTQEVFLKLFQKLHTFRGESQFSTWLHRVTINLVLMELRKHDRHTNWIPLQVETDSEEENTASQRIERTLSATPSILERIGLKQALADLPSRSRRVFVLHDAQGYGHKEIARSLGITEGTSKSQLHKARYRLRALLEAGRRAAVGRFRHEQK